MAARLGGHGPAPGLRDRRRIGARSEAPAGQLDGAAGDLDLVGARASGDGLDGAPIAVAGREVLLGVDARGILAEDRLDAAALLEEGVPVDRREQAEAEHAVADGDLVGGLEMVLAAEDLVGIGALRGQLGLEVIERLGGPILVAQELHQPDDERVGEPAEPRQRGGGDGGEGIDVGPGRVAGIAHLLLSRGRERPGVGAGQDVGRPCLGAPAFLPAPDHPLGQAAEVLEQDEAEHGRQGPELADRERSGLLEHPDEPGDPRLVELAVRMRHQGQRQRVDAGVTDQGRRRPAWAGARRSRGAGRAGPRGASRR